MSGPENSDTSNQHRGQRAGIDRRTGEVRGSGSGAGGGNPGEDFDSDPQAGGGAIPLTSADQGRMQASDRAEGEEQGKEGIPGGKPPEPPEKRPNVGSVTPDDYPEPARG